MKIWMPVVLFIGTAILLSCGNAQDSVSTLPETVSTPQIIHEVDTEIQVVDSPIVRDTFPKSTLLGNIDPSKDADFSLIESKHTSKSGIYMRREAYEAFVRMYDAAMKDGVQLKIVSATRPFNAQKGIWENKWTGKTIVGGKNLSVSVPDPVERAKAILRYSSMPGTSRHHWGTDIDLNNLENSYFETGTGKKIYDWLTAHAAEYGFCQPYSLMGPDRPRGYQEERWHWSYMPISSKYLEAYRAQIKIGDIKGFLGSETAAELNVIEDYVSGIAVPCKTWNPVKTD